VTSRFPITAQFCTPSRHLYLGLKDRTHGGQFVPVNIQPLSRPGLTIHALCIRLPWRAGKQCAASPPPQQMLIAFSLVLPIPEAAPHHYRPGCYKPL
jgi:hypothetical protein